MKKWITLAGILIALVALIASSGIAQVNIHTILPELDTDITSWKMSIEPLITAVDHLIG